MTKEQPLLFSGEMVRAILDGRKTQTRRVIKPQPIDMTSHVIRLTDGIRFETEDKYRKCPCGQPLNRLWVKETWRRARPEFPDGIETRADKVLHWFDDSDAANRTKEWMNEHNIIRDGKWRPSIYMPRCASRITLEVTDIRVERLQDITHEDIAAEGTAYSNAVRKIDSPGPYFCTERFKLLWNSINEKRGFGWNSNPWVWVVEFSRLT